MKEQWPADRSAEAKKAILKDRNDPGGKIMKALLARANEKLLDLAGVELVPAVDAEGAADDGDADASQGASQSSQGASQGSQGKAAAGGPKFLLVNRLDNPVKSEVSMQAKEYHALVYLVLELLAHGEGTMEEATLLDHWLGGKLRVSRDLKLPNQRLSVGELVTKTKVAEAFLRRSKGAGGVSVFSCGPRANLCLDKGAQDNFRGGLGFEVASEGQKRRPPTRCPTRDRLRKATPRSGCHDV